MGKHMTYEELSRGNWGRDSSNYDTSTGKLGDFVQRDVEVGCLIRIAEALEELGDRFMKLTIAIERLPYGFDPSVRKSREKRREVIVAGKAEAKRKREEARRRKELSLAAREVSVSATDPAVLDLDPRERGALPGATTRIMNALRRGDGIKTIRQLAAMTDDELLSLRNFGRASIELLHQILAELGVTVAPSPEPETASNV